MVQSYLSRNLSKVIPSGMSAPPGTAPPPGNGKSAVSLGAELWASRHRRDPLHPTVVKVHPAHQADAHRRANTVQVHQHTSEHSLASSHEKGSRPRTRLVLDFCCMQLLPQIPLHLIRTTATFNACNLPPLYPSPKLRPGRCLTGACPSSTPLEDSLEESEGSELRSGPPADMSSGLRLIAAAEMTCTHLAQRTQHA